MVMIAVLRVRSVHSYYVETVHNTHVRAICTAEIVNTVHTPGSVQRDFLVSTLSFKIVCVALLKFASWVPVSMNSLIVYSPMGHLSFII